MIDPRPTSHHASDCRFGARNPLIEQWIVETCMKCGYPELAGRISYGISTDPFFDEHGGYATTFLGNGGGRAGNFTIQPSLLDATPPSERLSEELGDP